MISSIPNVSLQPVPSNPTGRPAPGSAEPAADEVSKLSVVRPDHLGSDFNIERNYLRPIERGHRCRPGFDGIGNMIRELLRRIIDKLFRQLFGRMFGTRPPQPDQIQLYGQAQPTDPVTQHLDSGLHQGLGSQELKT